MGDRLISSDFRAIPLSTRKYSGAVSLQVTADDGMYHGNDSHYLGCGASALNVVLGALQMADLSAPSLVLDFGAGAGRVTRWLRAAFPGAGIHACDLRPQDMDFCQREFDATTWISGIDIDALAAPATYDLIWVGSVFTHLSQSNSFRLFDKLMSWLRPDGLLVASLHGRFAQSRQSEGTFVYIDTDAWAAINAGYDETGFGYHDYVNQDGYGISLTKLSWSAKFVESLPQARLVILSEKAWDGHHDVVAVQSRSVS